MTDFRVSSRTAATFVAADATRRNPFSQQNPPRYLGGYTFLNSSWADFSGQTRQLARHGKPRIPMLLVLEGARASARFGVWMGKTPRFPDRSGVLTLKRRKRRAPLPTTSGCTVRQARKRGCIYEMEW